MAHSLAFWVAPFLLLALDSPRSALAADCGPGPAVRLRHSHNDYLRKRPLWDALEHDFDSVEADVHLVDGELFVAHDRDGVRPDRTLERLYLEPLHRTASARGGWIHPGREFILLIDIKSEAVSTYLAARELLSRYEDMLTIFEDGAARPGAVTVLVSGRRPVELVAGEARRLVALDGDADDFTRYPADLMPWVSVKWDAVYGGRDTRRLCGLVARARALGRKTRAWGGPDTVWAWRLLHKAGVDVLHTDHLTRLNRFLEN